MNEFFAGGLIILAEVGGVLALGATLMIAIAARRARRRRKAAVQMVRNFKEDREARRDALLSLLTEVVKQAEDQVDGDVQRLMAREKSVYSRVLEAVLGQGAEGIALINQDVDALIEEYSRLARESVDREKDRLTQLEEENAELRQELEKLKEQKDKLDGHLQQAIQTMEVLFREYTAVYKDDEHKHIVNQIEADMAELKAKVGAA